MNHEISSRTPKNAISKLRNWAKWQRFSLNRDKKNETTFYRITSTASTMEEDFREKVNLKYCIYSGIRLATDTEISGVSVGVEISTPKQFVLRSERKKCK
jgi:hypothetical protein